MDEVEGLGAADFDFAHMGDVEEADGGSDGLVFVEYAGVLDGHVPAAEVDHFGTGLAGDGVERGGFEGRGSGHEP